MADSIARIREEIRVHPTNARHTERGWEPLFTADPRARIVVIGQAPGRVAQESATPWNDASGDTLRAWMGIDRETFYDATRVALVPMDFYFPGAGGTGDAPPRKDFASRWHPRLLALMPDVRLTLLVGAHAQKHYLPGPRRSLTATLLARADLDSSVMPLVHPSPLTQRWRARNPWFVDEVVPELRERVARALDAP